MNRVMGYLPSRICYFITHLHTTQRPIYLTRHGVSQYNELELIGGDSSLAPRYVLFRGLFVGSFDWIEWLNGLLEGAHGWMSS